MTPAILATCGLLYSMAVVDPHLPDASRQMADNAAARISQIAIKQGHREKVSELAFSLAERLDEHPEEVMPIAEAFGPTCRKLAGL